MLKKLSIITLLLLLLAMVFGQALPQDPKVISGSLENGLRYHIRVNSKPANRVAFRLYVHAGSVLEDEDQQGLAHFTEHMAFNGTQNFSRTELRDYLNSIGMGFAGGLNAYTSFDETVYQLSSPTDKPEQLRKAFTILSDWSHRLSFHPEELESERGVIIEEWRGGQGADTRMRDKTNKVIFAGSRYAERMPIGTYEVLSTFKRDSIVRFYKDWYRPDLQELIVVGDVDPQAMIALINEYFGSIPAAKNPRPRPLYPVPNHVETKVVVATDPEADNISLALTWKHEPLQVNDLPSYYKNLCSNLFQTMLNARLEELAQEADPPFSYAYNYAYNMTRSRSIYSIGAMVPESKINTALSALLVETERADRFGFSPGELERAKQRYLRQAQRQVAEQNDQLSERMIWQIVASIRSGNPKMSAEQEYQMMQELFPRITLEEVNALTRNMITAENLVVTITGPAKEGLVYPSEAQILELVANAKKMEVTAYQDDTLDEPLLSIIPAARKVKSEKTDKASGIRIWTLANGIKVYSKKTEFKQDEILLSARRAGGYSLYPPQDIETAKNAAGIVMNAGFGNFDLTRLQKALSGTIANAAFDIGLYSDTISGAASPKDLERLFQLIYQHISAPRMDKNSFDSYIARSKGMLENKLLSPEAAFYDSVGAFFAANNPYLAPESVEKLMAIKQDRAYQIFAERFGNMEGFDFVFVGNFDEAELKHYCETYLANLPVNKKRGKVAYRDVGIRPLSGFQRKDFRLGQDPKATVISRISAKMPHSYSEKLRLDATTLLLNERLRERIREERSGVYSVYAYSNLSKHAFPNYSITFMLQCSPERHQELSDEMLVVLDEMLKNPITPEEASFVATTMRRNYENSVITNRYWLNNISENIWNKVPLTAFEKNPAFYDSINPVTLQKSAAKYLLHRKAYIKASQLPVQ